MTVVMTVGGITLSSLENTDIRGQDSLTNMVSRPCLVSDNKTKQYRMTRKGSHNIMAKGLRTRRTVRHSRALGSAFTSKAEKYMERRHYGPVQHGSACRRSVSDCSVCM